MTRPSNGKPLEFRVSFSGAIAKVIDELRYEAFLSGRLEQFNRAWRVILQRLRSDPSNFGELIQPFVHLKLKTFVGSVYPLTVRFGVHEDLPIVFIAKVVLAALS